MAQKNPGFNLSGAPDAFLYVADARTNAYGCVTLDWSMVDGSDQWLGPIRRELKALRDLGARRSHLVAFLVVNAPAATADSSFQTVRSGLSALFGKLEIRAYFRSFSLDPAGSYIKLGDDGHSMLIKGAQPAPKKLKVLIVDDSKVIHKMLGDIISKDPRFEVCGYALDPIEAETRIEALKPDVLTLDFQMPRMDGLTYLKQMIPVRQLPVLMISGASSEDGRLALQALEFGAFDFIQKPAADAIEDFSEILCEKIFAATQIKRTKIKSRHFQKRMVQSGEGFDADRIVLIGSSTGGTVALSEIIPTLPAEFPPIVIVQHIPEKFSALFAERLDKISAMDVKEAEHGDVLQVGRVLVAPGGRQLKIIRSGGRCQVEINDDPPYNRHRPSVDYMFNSAVRILGSEVVAVLLTGMGKDGAKGLLALKEKGAFTIAQDADSCVVYGMPKAAAELGAAQLVLPLEQVADKLQELSRGKERPRARLRKAD